MPADWSAPTVPLGSLVPGTGGQPSRVVLFRRPIEMRCETPADLGALVYTVLVEQVDLERDSVVLKTREGWTGVTPTERQPQGGAALTALSAMEDSGMVDVAGLLHLGDVDFREDKATHARMLALKVLREQEVLEEEACVKTCEAERKDTPLPDGKAYDCTCLDLCTHSCDVAPLPTSWADKARDARGGDFLQGPLEKPTALLRGVVEKSGGRAVFVRYRQTLVHYAGDKADVVLVRVAGDAPLRIHVLDWKESKGKASIAAITTFIVGPEAVRVVRYRATT